MFLYETMKESYAKCLKSWRRYDDVMVLRACGLSRWLYGGLWYRTELNEEQEPKHENARDGNYVEYINL